MFSFFRTAKDDRPRRVARLSPKMVLAGLLASFAVITGVALVTAPAASAKEITTTNKAQDDQRGPMDPEPTTPPPTKSGGTVGVKIDPTLDKTDYVSFEAWFYENGKTGSIPSPYGATPINYDWVANRCGGTSADRSYPYAGNAIPIPNSAGEAGTTRLVWVKWVTTVESHSNNYTYTETGSALSTDPVTGNPSYTPYSTVIATAVQRWQEYKYSISCKYQTSPTWQYNDCVTYGDTKINGPYDQTWTAMASVAGGGTNRRVPGPVPNEVGVIGQKTEKASINLGLEMQKVPQDPKTNAPLLPNVWANCVPNSGNHFDASATEKIDSLGRYVATINQWWVRTYYQVFSDQNWQNVYKGIAAMPSGTGNMFQNLGGVGYYIRQIGTPTLTTTYDYFKIICASGTDPSGTVAVKYLPEGKGVSLGRDSVTWGDSDPTYYTWNCGDTPGTDGGSDTRDDFLQCANYTSPSGDITIDGKNAAPLQIVNQVIDGETVDAVRKGDTYYITSAADPVHATWQQIRINNQAGENVNVAGKNAVWDYNYKLADWSSPMLKNKDKNSLDQPYHGWEDKTAATVLAAEVPLGTKWEPDKFYEYQTLAYTYTTKPYTYHTEYSYLPYTYTTTSGTRWAHIGWNYSWGCSCGGKCGNWSNGDPYCQSAVWGWENYSYTTKSAPPAGWIDNGSSYQKNTSVKDPAPAGYYDNGTEYAKVNPPPYGYTDVGNGVYTSVDKLNTTGKTGGIAFDKWRKWPSNAGLSACTVDLSSYSSALTGTYQLMCGDNVTDSVRGAYFRFFMSSTAGSQGWQVTPFARVTVDVQASFKQIDGFTMNADGTMSLSWSNTVTKWVRQSYDCPAQPLKIMVERVVN